MDVPERGKTGDGGQGQEERGHEELGRAEQGERNQPIDGGTPADSAGGDGDGTFRGYISGPVRGRDRERRVARLDGSEGDALTGALAISPAGMPVAAVAAAGHEGMAELFRLHHRRVLVAAYRITGSMADAEDVAQAVFLRVMASGAPVENVGSYLYRAAANGALDVLRRRKSAGKEEIEEDGPGMSLVSQEASPEAEAWGRQLGGMLRVAIGELPARAAEMFTLRYLEDLGNREIADVMGTSQAVVAVTLFQARAKLKKRLRELEGAGR
jgi:RNA polymerase sigma factor (sigma-70 family)